MINYVGRALYEQQTKEYKQFDADRAIRLFEEYDIPITTNKEETPDGTLFGPFPDGSYILSFIHNGEENMFSASSKDKINQLFQDITFASVEDRMIEKIDKKKESKPDHHPMLPSWEKYFHLAKAIELKISKALSYCDYRMDHLMENITHFVEPNNTDAIKDILKGLKNVGDILRDNQNAPPSRKMKIASTEYPTPLGFIIVVNYNQSHNRLRVSTIKYTKKGERFTPASFASDGPYTPEFLDAIQSGTLGLNACPLCLSEGCDACQNGIVDLSTTQETFLRNIISNQFKTAGVKETDNSNWLYAFSQLNSMLSNFKKLHKVSWTISDDKLNSLFQELLPLFVKYALIIRDQPPSVSQPMVDSANKIISELSLIFNIEV